MKPFIKILSATMPSLVVKMAYNKIVQPTVFKLRPHEIEILDKAEKDFISFNSFNVQTYKWGNGPKKVLLVHGWEGQAGNFAEIIESLVDNNYTVYAFDAPSHGFSSKGKTTMFEFSALVKLFIKKHAIKNIISHSFGSVGTTHCLSNNNDLKVDKYVMITTPDRFEQRLNDVAQMVGLNNRVKNKLVNKLENEFNVKVNDQNVSDFVQKVNVEKAYILHDVNDKIIDIQQSIDVQKAWGSTCELEKIENTGHFRILRTDTVVEKVINFLEN
ncbi:alpha/beta hydrolase [Flammeovirga kamogawensis]|uniref:Alpha/beta hydrolase n=1 Tax=Flammeovirga kamogawensis TaxID=373891 RepID=A0ABX8H0Y5_9BACT|nr:alpha/beta hydrolase [Flammeovirga kamogawensis]MBB6463297.1 triacylglycerol esterase/lipase EstA (alpha/beta hydrolase family) [Flammeovirga kamogawensis]QWG09553.1 alpha/beta hydrolase [Flammeovirga kamogawensis]TRX65067.1 alpha/beta hydrolase [Flammeovirga kamogawensis]